MPCEGTTLSFFNPFLFVSISRSRLGNSDFNETNSFKETTLSGGLFLCN